MKKFTENIYILEKLGQGGMGEVFKAKIVKPEQGFEKIVALKVLPEYTPQAEKKKEALLKEARIVANLNHPNINQVYDVGEAEGTPYVIMDLVEGHDLREIIKTAKEKGIQLSISNSIEIALAILDALEYAHSLPSPIVHRDISPHNVMVTNQGTVKLLDFGLSKIQENTDQSKTEGYVGKYSYLPLEVIEGKTYKAEHDIYAVGLTLYELLTLEKVYGGNIELEIIQKIKEGHIDPASAFNFKIPKELDELLMKWIKLKEAKRIKDILEIRKELLLIKKELVATSSLKEEVVELFSEKRSFKETVIEKRNNKKKSLSKWKYITFLSVLMTLLLGYFLYSKVTQIERTHPFITLSFQGKYYSIAPIKKKGETEITYSKKNYPRFVCEQYCSMQLAAFYSFIDPIELKDDSKTNASLLYNEYFYKIANTNQNQKIFSHCSQEKYCTDAEELLSFVKTHHKLHFNNNLKTIQDNNRKELKRTRLAPLAQNLQKDFKDKAPIFNLVFKNLKESEYFQSSPRAKYDFIKTPSEIFPSNKNDCYEWALLNYLYLSLMKQYFVGENEIRIILIPDESKIQPAVIYSNKDIAFNFSSNEQIESDSIFKKGLCYLWVNNFEVQNVVFWIPINPLSKNGK